MSDMIRHNDMTQWYECNDITQWCEQWSDSRIPLSHIIMSMQECMALSWCAMQYIGSVCFIDTSHDPIVYIIAMSHVIRVMSLILTSHINESCHRTCMGVYGSIRCAMQCMCNVHIISYESCPHALHHCYEACHPSYCTWLIRVMSFIWPSHVIMLAQECMALSWCAVQ